MLPVPVVPITGASLVSTAATSIARDAINSSISVLHSQYGNNAKDAKDANDRSNLLLTIMNDEIIANRVVEEINHINHLVFGINKASAGSWHYHSAGVRNIATEADFTAAKEDLKKALDDSEYTINFYPSAVLFHERLGMFGGELDTFKLMKSADYQLRYENNKLTKQLPSLKRELLDKYTEKGVFQDYAEYGDQTPSLKGSQDFKNLLLSERLSRAKHKTNLAIHENISKSHKRFQQLVVKKELLKAGGRLPILK